MRTNYETESTVMEGFDTEIFKKAQDNIGSYKKDQLVVRGILKHSKSKYGDSYALAIENTQDAERFFLNIPAWLGKNIMEDFKASGQTIDEYFDGASIDEIKSFYTNNGTSVKILFYTK